jgi:hypothetical protein
MNYFRVLLAALAATIVFVIYGFVVHGWLIAKDYIPYPEGVYRAGEAAQTHMPFGLAGLFVAIAVFATIYAKSFARLERERVRAWGYCLEFSWQELSSRSTMPHSISVEDSPQSWRQASSLSGRLSERSSA